MKRTILIISFIFLIFTFSAYAQTGQDEPMNPIDIILEEDAGHNLNVARQYFKTKKAYQAVLLRFEETFAAYPQFSQMDEFLYYAGMSSYYLSENKGRQKINYDTLSDEEKIKYAPERLRENAVAYLGLIIENYPESKYRDNAEDALKKLKREDK